MDVIDTGITTSITDEIVAFVDRFALRQAPPEALGRAGDAITDTLGCIVLGATQPLEDPLRTALFGRPLEAVATIELAPANLAAARPDAQGTAALYLGTLAHAADFDDISHPAYCHATALLLPALLVRGAALGVDGPAVLAAHVVGVEVLGQLARQIDKDDVPAWHPTSMLGTIGATAALCRLERLAAGVTRAALSIAASMACGVRENFGTMTKPLHCGFPGRSAILATRLAASGFSSAHQGIEGRHGMLEVYARLAPWDAKLWGDPLEVMTETGLALKAYPSCAATHPAIDACRAIFAECGRLDAGRVVGIHVGMSRFAMRPLIHEWPTTSLEAKFSLRYCIATALHDGDVDLRSFDPERLHQPGVEALMRHVTHGIDPRVMDDREFAATVRIEFSGGGILERRVDVASGKPGNWLSPEHLARKFRDCAGDGAAAATLFDASRRVSSDATAAGLLTAVGAAIVEAISRPA